MRLPSRSVEFSSQSADFFKNSFKQLSDVQQKQVGLIVGSCVADFYAVKYLQHSEEAEEDAERGQQQAAAAHVGPGRSHTGKALTAEERLADGPLVHHSFSYELQSMLVHTMGASAGSPHLHLEDVAGRWAAVATSLPASFGHWHGSLLHTANVLSVLPAMYPYASDASLRRFIGPYAAFLTDPSPLLSLPAEQRHASMRSSATTAAAAASTSAAAVAEACAASRNCAISVMGVVQRLLQTNPDAVRNAAFRAVPGTEMIFPADVAIFVAPGAAAEDASSPSSSLPGAASMPSSALRHDVGVATHGALVAEVLQTCRAATSFREGVDRVLGVSSVPAAAGSAGRISLPGGITPSAAGAGVEAAAVADLGGRRQSSARNRRAQTMLAGALLGARFGIRSVPSEWLLAANDHAAVSSFAIGIAQTAWNPGS